MAQYIYNGFNKYNVAPYASGKIGVYDSNGVKVGEIPLDSFKPDYGERLFRFGVLSDVHQQTTQSSENNADLRNALNVFNNKESVDFTCICGDLTQNGIGSDTEIGLYSNIVANYSPNTPVYTTTGNHDCQSSGIKQSSTYFNRWKANTNLDTTAHTLTYSDTEISFEFTHRVQLGDGTTKNFHFLFFGMCYWSFGSEGTVTYMQEDIDWLEDRLRTYRDELCFVFTHMFFSDRAGNFRQIYPSGNWLANPQKQKLEELCDKYRNSIWFSGHSHWKWYLQKYHDNRTNESALYDNVWHESNIGGGWVCHVAGCANPIDSNGTTSRESDNDYAYKASEGAIVDIYENYVDIRGVSFKAYDYDNTNRDTDYNTRYLPIATYRLNTKIQCLYTDPVEGYWIRYGGKTVDQRTQKITKSGDYVCIAYDNIPEGCLISTPEFISSSGGTVVVTADDIQVWYDGMQIPFSQISGIGVYTESGYGLSELLTESGYTAPLCDETTNNAVDSNYANERNVVGIQFNTSASKFITGGTSWCQEISADHPVIVKIKNLRLNGILVNNQYGDIGGGGGGDEPVILTATPLKYSEIAAMSNDSSIKVIMANPHKETGYFLGYENGSIGSGTGFNTVNKLNTDAFNLINLKDDRYLFYITKTNDEYYLTTDAPIMTTSSWTETEIVTEEYTEYSAQAVTSLSGLNNKKILMQFGEKFVTYNSGSTTNIGNVITELNNNSGASDYVYTYSGNTTTAYIKNNNNKYLYHETNSTALSWSNSRLNFSASTTNGKVYFKYSAKVKGKNNTYYVGINSRNAFSAQTTQTGFTLYEITSEVKTRQKEVIVPKSKEVYNVRGLSPNNNGSSISWSTPVPLSILGVDSLSSDENLPLGYSLNNLERVSQLSAYLNAGSGPSSLNYSTDTDEPSVWEFYNADQKFEPPYKVARNAGKMTHGNFEYNYDYATDTLTLDFTAASQGVILWNDKTTSSPVTVTFDEIHVFENGVEVTQDLSTYGGLGFYTTGNTASGTRYTLVSGNNAVELSSSQGDDGQTHSDIQFNTSSSYVGQFPVHVVIKGLDFHS